MVSSYDLVGPKTSMHTRVYDHINRKMKCYIKSFSCDISVQHYAAYTFDKAFCVVALIGSLCDTSELPTSFTFN